MKKIILACAVVLIYATAYADTVAPARNWYVRVCEQVKTCEQAVRGHLVIYKTDNVKLSIAGNRNEIGIRLKGTF